MCEKILQICVKLRKSCLVGLAPGESFGELQLLHSRAFFPLPRTIKIYVSMNLQKANHSNYSIKMNVSFLHFFGEFNEPLTFFPMPKSR
jgi:hypothetical protein